MSKQLSDAMRPVPRAMIERSRPIWVALGVLIIAASFVILDSQLLRAAGDPHVIADFSGYWVRPESGRDRIYYQPESGPGPIVIADDAGDYMIGDYSDPILLPHAAEAVRAHGDQGRAGVVLYPPWSLCWPAGVPLALNMAEPVQILQTEDQVTILYQRGQQIRRIDLNRKHPENIAPSWYGHSVGHYEGDDTLVIDTIAQDTRSEVDRFGTPRSDAMRVVERYRVAEDRQSLTIEFMVEDPKTFTTPWSARTGYVPLAAGDEDERSGSQFTEVICSENNRDAAGGDFPIPVGSTRAF